MRYAFVDDVVHNSNNNNNQNDQIHSVWCYLLHVVLQIRYACVRLERSCDFAGGDISMLLYQNVQNQSVWYDLLHVVLQMRYAFVRLERSCDFACAVIFRMYCMAAGLELKQVRFLSDGERLHETQHFLDTDGPRGGVIQVQ